MRGLQYGLRIEVIGSEVAAMHHSSVKFAFNSLRTREVVNKNNIIEMFCK
jgi:hypothetical protein